MSSFEYTGELENISPRQLEFVSEVLKNHGYNGKKVSVSPMGKSGDNYGSFIKRFTIEIENEKMFKMIAKIAPSNGYLGDQSLSGDIFTNEMLLYTEILPKFVQLQRSEGVPTKDLLSYPFCYGTLSEKNQEMLLLEDLEVNNYVMLDKKQPLTDRVVKIVLQNLANFHSMSYVLKTKDSQTYGRYSGALVNVFLNAELMSKFHKFLEIALNDIKSVFDNDRHSNVIKDIMQKNFWPTNKEILAADCGSKYSIIQHGDLWTNNVMFQMPDDQPAECILIDYQMARESLPAADIHNLIFSCTDYETRSKHYYEWMDYYHSELDRYLNNFGFKADNVYPRDIFDADLKRYGKPCLAGPLMMITFLLRETQEAPEMSALYDTDVKKIADDIGINKLREQTVGAIKKRIEGVLDSCYEYGYLTESP